LLEVPKFVYGEEETKLKLDLIYNQENKCRSANIGGDDMEDVDASLEEDNASFSWCVGGPLHNISKEKV